MGIKIKTEREKFEEWYENEKKKGLVSMDLFLSSVFITKDKEKEEEIFLALNNFVKCLKDPNCAVDRKDVF